MRLLNSNLTLFSLSFAFLFSSIETQSQDNNTASKEQTILEEMTVLGSRRSDPRSAMDAAVPIDVINSEELNRQGNTDPIDILTAVIPSFSANREPISDAATLVRPVNLRALPSDHTLVLVNGKRRHRGAVVGEFISGVNRGAQGVDIAPLFGASLALLRFREVKKVPRLA